MKTTEKMIMWEGMKVQFVHDGKFVLTVRKATFSSRCRLSNLTYYPDKFVTHVLMTGTVAITKK